MLRLFKYFYLTLVFLFLSVFCSKLVADEVVFGVDVGYDGDDNSRTGVSLYSNLGGDAAADMWLFYYGFRF